jgi:hypothetical protein
MPKFKKYFDFSNSKHARSELQTGTVNQLLFAASLFHDSSLMIWLVASNFRDYAFVINIGLHRLHGSRQEIFATMRFSRYSQNFLAHE